MSINLKRMYVLDVTDGSGREPICDVRTWAVDAATVRDILWLDGIDGYTATSAIMDSRESGRNVSVLVGQAPHSPYQWSLTPVVLLPLV